MAGAEVIVAALAPQLASDDDESSMTKTMEHIAILLPGLGEPIPVRMTSASPGNNRSLAELNIRGKTGATILAITRRDSSGQKVVVPSGSETLRDGDIIALAGSHEAVEAAKKMLTVSRRRSTTPASAAPEDNIARSAGSTAAVGNNEE